MNNSHTNITKCTGRYLKVTQILENVLRANSSEFFISFFSFVHAKKKKKNVQSLLLDHVTYVSHTVDVTRSQLRTLVWVTYTAALNAATAAAATIRYILFEFVHHDQPHSPPPGTSPTIEHVPGPYMYTGPSQRRRVHSLPSPLPRFETSKCDV